MNEHETMGKLVEEIADVLNQWRKCGRLERTPDIPLSIYKKDCPGILEITEGESAKSLITLILSAVHAGDLDEELGVVGHGRIFKNQNNWQLPGYGWFVNGTCNGDLEHIEKGYPMIALRPLTGTGKEGKE